MKSACERSRLDERQYAEKIEEQVDDVCVERDDGDNPVVWPVLCNDKRCVVEQIADHQQGAKHRDSKIKEAGGSATE